MIRCSIEFRPSGKATMKCWLPALPVKGGALCIGERTYAVRDVIVVASKTAKACEPVIITVDDYS